VLDPSSPAEAVAFPVGPTLLDASFLAHHPVSEVVYVVSRASQAGPTEGSVSACAVDSGTGRFSAVDTFDSGGAGPCHVSVSPGGGVLLVANYAGGTITSYLLGPGGRIQRRVDVIAHHGSGPHPQRQEAAHPHMVAVDPVTGHLLVPDLGTDRIVLYEVEEDTARLSALPDAAVAVPAGAGPRHVAFFADGDAVVANELDSTVALLTRRGRGFVVTDVISTVPSPVAGDAAPEPSYPSAIRISPDTGLVYVANRGPDTVTTVGRSPDRQSLRLVSTVSCGGRWPRDLVVDADGDRLLVANQYGQSVTALPISESGTPSAPVSSWTVPNAGCILEARAAVLAK
jgi:6-phosphogluconolactonase